MTTNNGFNNTLEGTLLDLNGNKILQILPIASAVNYLTVQNNSTTNPVLIAAKGSDTNVALNVEGQGNAGVNILGTSTNNSAPATFIGEVITSTVTSASATTYTSGSVTSMTSLALSAGNWDVYANFIITGTTVTQIQGGISLTNNTLPATELTGVVQPLATSAICGITVPAQPIKISTTTTPVYIVVFALGTGTMTMAGNIYARRRY